jgi:NAD(P)H-hydrate repair Nnr-like enzyme with NAD(P)H-hydrate epimerase domain
MQRLRKQLNNLKVSFVGTDDFIDALDDADVVLDAIFGESVSGPSLHV